MSYLIQVAATLVTSQASLAPMSIDQIISEISKVHRSLVDLESGKQINALDEVKPRSNKECFLKSEVICMVCGKKGFKTLGRHLSTAHSMKPAEYRKQFGIPRTQALTSKTYSQARRKSALERGLGDNLARARAIRRANIELKKQVVAVVDECPVAEVVVDVVN